MVYYCLNHISFNVDEFPWCLVLFVPVLQTGYVLNMCMLKPKTWRKFWRLRLLAYLPVYVYIYIYFFIFICASGVGRHGFALIISNHHVILAQVPWSKIASFCFLGLIRLWRDHNNPHWFVPPGRVTARGTWVYQESMWRCALTKCCCLLALGWTSASMCTRCCWAGKSKRLGPFGIQCSKWCTWELTHPHQYCNPRTCPPSAVCHVARHHVLGVRTGGGFQFPFIGTWTHRAVFAQEVLSVASTWDRYHAHLTRLWTLSQSKCMPLGTACKTSSQSMWPSSRIGWLVETMGFHRATSLPCGVSGRTGQLCGMSQSSSWQTSRDLSTRLGDSYGCCWVQKRQKWSLFHPYACVVCTECPSCGTHWCDDCRRDYLLFCAMCGYSSDGEA